MLSLIKKNEYIKQIKKKEFNIIIVIIKSFTAINIRKAINGGNPVVKKIYHLKLSKTFNSQVLSSNNNARLIFSKGLNDKHKKNKIIKYLIVSSSKCLEIFCCANNIDNILLFSSFEE